MALLGGVGRSEGVIWAWGVGGGWGDCRGGGQCPGLRTCSPPADSLKYLRNTPFAVSMPEFSLGNPTRWGLAILSPFCENSYVSEGRKGLGAGGGGWFMSVGWRHFQGAATEAQALLQEGTQW